MSETSSTDDGGAKPVDILDAEVEPVAPKRRWRLVLVVVAAAMALIGGYVFVLYPYVLDPLSSPAKPQVFQRAGLDEWRGALAQLEERAAALEARVERLANAIPANDIAQLRGQLGEMNTRLATLADAVSNPGAAPEIAQRLAAIERKIVAKPEADMALASRVAMLEGLLTQRSVERGDAADGTRQLAFALTLGQLRDMVRQGGPYAPELAALRKINGEPAAAFAILAEHAERGVASLGQLQARFAPVPAAVLRAQIQPADDWWRTALARLAALVTVRRVGEVAGAEPDAVVARAEVRLKVGDLAGALAELAQLSGAAADAASAWRAEAERRLSVERALAEINGAAIGQLARDKRTP